MSDATPPKIFLQSGRDKRLGGGHPWVYANEVRMDGDARAIPPGSPVTLCRVDGKPLAVGTFNSHTLICFRAFSSDPETALDRGFIADRLRRAVALRTRLFEGPYYRAVHGEADGLPGLMVDLMGDVVVAQLSTAGTETLRGEILAAIDEVLAPRAVVLRNDGAGRTLEGLDDGVEVVKGQQGGDPAAVAFDATQAAIARKVDVLILDTAGRLHTQSHLMDQLSKIRRVVEKQLPGAPHEVLLVIDATTGQNGVNQAKVFAEATEVTGIFLSKLDGSARGGIVIAIREELDLPVKFIGVGETPEDVQPFDPASFVEAMFAVD